ncbi:hypothetical protein Tco_0782819 [Tanacetum coccineum]
MHLSKQQNRYFLLEYLHPLLLVDDSLILSQCLSSRDTSRYLERLGWSQNKSSILGAPQGEGAQATGVVPGIKSIWNYLGRLREGQVRDMDTKLLSAQESNNTLARCSSLGILVGGLSALIFIMPFLSTVLSQMAYFVTSITLDSARSYVMQSAFLTQGTVSSVVGVSVTVVVVVEVLLSSNFHL